MASPDANQKKSLDEKSPDAPPHLSPSGQDSKTIEKRLKKLKSVIGSRQRSLNKARLERDDLLRILASRLGKIVTPIDKLLDDVLLMIFTDDALVNHDAEAKWFQDEDWYPREPRFQTDRNCPLMLTCKRWYNLVVQAPRLWNHITIYAEFTEDLRRLWSYAVLCLERSKLAPLDLTIAFNTDVQKLNLTQYVDVWSNFDQFPSFNLADTPYCLLLVEQILCHLERGWPRGIELEELAFIMTLAILRGPGSCHMSRWRSLRLRLPYLHRRRAAAAQTWNWLDAATPQLEGFTLIAVIKDNDYEDANKIELTGLPDLHRLKSLTYSGAINMPSILHRLPALESFCVLDDWSEYGILDADLPQLPSWKRLFVEGKDYSHMLASVKTTLQGH